MKASFMNHERIRGQNFSSLCAISDSHVTSPKLDHISKRGCKAAAVDQSFY